MIFLHQLHTLKSVSIKPWVEQGARPVRPARDQSPIWFERWSYMINNCLLFRQRFASQPRHIYRIIPPLIQRHRLAQTSHKFTRPIKRRGKAAR